MHRPEFEKAPGTTTALSRHAWQTGAVRLIWRLACGSLLGLLLMTTASSCIIADPPQYTNPVQTPPQLNTYLADPPLAQVRAVFGNTTGVTFSVPVRSEDAGEDLRAVFWEDYGTASPHAFNSQLVTASTYSATNRTITSIPFRVGTLDKGCHTISLVVAHLSTFKTMDQDSVDSQRAKTDAAIITWWVVINPPADALNTLPDCPTQTPSL